MQISTVFCSAFLMLQRLTYLGLADGVRGKATATVAAGQGYGPASLSCRGIQLEIAWTITMCQPCMPFCGS